MTQAEQQKAAKRFISDWTKKEGYEKGECQKFWLDLLCNVYGIKDFANFINFEDQVKDKILKEVQDEAVVRTVTNFIDAYIPSTKVMIEQKSSNKNLLEPIRQSDGMLLTPFQQARKYISELPLSLHPKWIVTCNFNEFLIYDMEHPNNEPQQVLLKNLEKDFYRLQFLVDSKNMNIRREEEISLKAGELVGKLYDALYKQYREPDEKSLHSLNILCVRIVFCLYAEDAGLFGSRTSFDDYIKSFSPDNLRLGVKELFKALDTEPAKRDKYNDAIKPFPYVNGGLFKDEDIEIPNFSQEVIDVILKYCAPFDWSQISPTIFGAVFESTLNPETRRKGGMHYTSIENIHKVIDPLFMEDLNKEFEKICEIKVEKLRNDNLIEFQQKLGSLTFLDPACGSGNFLTETFLSLRRLENKVLKILKEGYYILSFDEFIHVKISQFYGIEINDFAVTVAKTALWIAESQMMAETESILSQNIPFLPLKTNAGISEGNALRIDWPKTDFIMGNPPFVGARLMDEHQKSDVLAIWGYIKNIGNLDYVSCWYKKAADIIQGTAVKTALVSTNSITQGEQPAIIWKNIFRQGIKIDFAWRTFRWDSESNSKAHVHCVIIGFSDKSSESSSKYIFDEGGNKKAAVNINGYLIDAPDIFVESRSKPLCCIPEIGIGNKPIDGGNYLFTEGEMIEFIKSEPASEKYFHRWIGSDEFINRYYRYCLWLGDCTPTEIKKMPECYKRVQAVREFRLASKSVPTQKLADNPTRFHVENFPQEKYIVIPKVSSEKRRYIPIGLLTPDIFASDLVFIISKASMYHFGILTSNVHNSWMRAVAGRLKSDYRYSKDIVYNNFPWPNPAEAQKARIEQTAQAILDARAKYPDSSLADLYDETLMPPELRKAHRENDKAVMQAYGFDYRTMTESECVAELFKLYQKLAK